MPSKRLMILLILACAALYAAYLNQQRLRCLASGGTITYRTIEPVGPNLDIKKGIPKPKRREMVCIDGGE